MQRWTTDLRVMIEYDVDCLHNGKVRAGITVFVFITITRKELHGLCDVWFAVGCGRCGYPQQCSTLAYDADE